MHSYGFDGDLHVEIALMYCFIPIFVHVALCVENIYTAKYYFKKYLFYQHYNTAPSIIRLIWKEH